MRFAWGICRSRLYVEKVDASTFKSGYWPITEEDAKRLIGGMLYLHEAKPEPSYFGGIVERFRVAEESEVPEPQLKGRMIFTFRPTLDMRGKPWEGRDDPMAFVGGVIDD